MGYCIEMIGSNFTLVKRSEDEIINDIKLFIKSFKDKYFGNNLMWVDKNIILESNNIEEIFEEIRYPLTKNIDDKYVIEEFTGEKLGNDFEIFQAIAPYVEDGSYLEFEGEDNDRWRYVFSNGECKEVAAKISY